MESKAMKREYMKPTMNQLLAGSPLDSVDTGLGEEDDFTIDDTPAGDGFWGR